MRLASHTQQAPATSPIDLVESLLSANQWTFDRRSDEEMAAQVPGRWCDYSLFFAWNEDAQAIHFSCAFDMRVPAEKRRSVYELLGLINERVWLGHFVLWADDGLPLFRHVLLLRGVQSASVEQIEDLVHTAIGDCERFYPAFQYAVWGGKSAREAIEVAMIETVGEA